MWKTISLLIVVATGFAASANTTITAAPTTTAKPDTVLALAAKISSDVDNLTAQILAQQQMCYDSSANQTALIKKQADDMGLNTASCFTLYNPLLILCQTIQISGINALASAKKAILFTITLGYIPGAADALTRASVLNTYATTEIGYKTAGDNLVIANNPVYLLLVGLLNTCYNNLISSAPPTTKAPTTSTTAPITSTTTKSATTTTSAATSSSTTAGSTSTTALNDKVLICKATQTAAVTNLTAQVQAELQAVYNQNARANQTATLKNKAAALGVLTNSSCSVEVKALSDLHATQVTAIVNLALAKQAVLNTAMQGYNAGDSDADTRFGVCTTFGTTLIGYKTQGDNLVIADDPVELLAVQNLQSCYSLLIAGAPAPTA